MSHQYIVLAKIADSPIGEIFEGCNTETQQKVSVLQMAPDLCHENFDANWEKLSKTFQLRHEFVESVVDFDKVSHRIILPERGGTMGDMIGKPCVRVQQRVVRAVIYDTLELLDFFQQRGFVHGDIRPETLLLPIPASHSQKTQPKIRLAYSSGVYYGNEIIVANRDRKYLAPEMLNPKFGPVSSATDMYCLAFASLELLFGDEFNNMFQRIGPDGKPHWGALHGVGDERLPALKNVFPGIDSDLYLFFHRVILRKVVRRPASPREILSQMKTRYAVHKICRKIGRFSIDRGIVYAFREFFLKEDWDLRMSEEKGTAGLSDDARQAFLVEKAVSHLQSFAVSGDILDRVREMHVTFEKPDSYDSTLTVQSNASTAGNENRTASAGMFANDDNEDRKAKVISNLTGKEEIEIAPEDASLLETLSEFTGKFQQRHPDSSSEGIPFSLTSKAWWDAQFKKKPVLFGLFGGLALMLLMILMISPSRKADEVRSRLPGGCVPVSEKGIDPETGLPRVIEVAKLKDFEPLRLVLIKPGQDSRNGRETTGPRLGERNPEKTEESPFYIAEKEVGFAQFEYLVNDVTVLKNQADANRVKTEVAHEQAEVFCGKFGGRLPTEDQWECAMTNPPDESAADMPGTMLQWCAERYVPGLGEEQLAVSDKARLVKGFSPLTFSNPERRPTWRAPADAEGAPDIAFRPVVVPLTEGK